jgi:hypothetical protein
MDWKIARTQEENGNYNYNITVNGVLYNNSSNANINMAALQSQIEKQISDVFNVSGDGYSVNMNFNLRTVTSVDDISSTDHVFQIVNQNKFEDGVLADATVGGFNIRIGTDLVESTINGTNNRSIAHELGHTGGLYDRDDFSRVDAFIANDLNNLMKQSKYIQQIRGGDDMNARNLESTQINYIWNQYDAGKLNQNSPIGSRINGFRLQSTTRWTMPILVPTFRNILKR